MVTKQDILFSLSLMGIQSGDLLLVHSALSSIGQVEGGADTVIDALLETIGPKGTLVMSTLTGWDSRECNNCMDKTGKISGKLVFL